MKRRKKILIAIGITLVALPALLFAVFFVLTIDIKVGSFAGRASDYDRFLYDGSYYREQHFVYKERGKRLGGVEERRGRKVEFFQISPGSVYAINDDDNHDFLHVIYFRGLKRRYVREGIEIPTSGTVTEVYNDSYSSTTDAADIKMFQRIANLTGELTAFTTDNLAASQREFYFAYDNCLVAAHTPGSIVYAEGNFFFVKEGDADFTNFPDMVGAGKGIIITDPAMLDFIKADPILVLPASYDG